MNGFFVRAEEGIRDYEVLEFRRVPSSNLLTDNEKARKMGEAGRKRAVEDFDWTVVAKKFDRYLEQTLS